jgi:hypothetical protein
MFLKDLNCAAGNVDGVNVVGEIGNIIIVFTVNLNLKNQFVKNALMFPTDSNSMEISLSGSTLI